MNAQPLVELRGITKRFPGVVANDDISLAIHRGEIHTLLGENGAGKSTLMNILAGMLRPDAGQLLVNGHEITLASPRQALKHGIGTVYQHFTLVPNLTVIENVILGLDIGFVLKLGQAEQQLQALLGDFGLAGLARTEVRFLSIGQQQRVELIKVLFRGSQVLLLDEPTSVLTPPEAHELFEILLRLKARGVAIGFITHKLDEALAVSDRVTILRQGQKVAELSPAELTHQERATLTERIVALMFGGYVPPARPASDTRTSITGEVVCRLENITALGERGSPAVQGLNLRLSAGEIFGLAGVDGNGQKELGEVLAGQRRIISGQLILAGFNVTNKGVAAAENAGLSYITDDRLGEGCVPSLSVAENAVMKVVNQRPFSRWTVLNRLAINTYTQRLIQSFNIKTTGPTARLGTLSGGNIQKLLLARELIRRPKVLICNQPTQGLDVLTTEFILQTLRTEATKGMAVLLISSELDELMALSDRIGVMYRGRLLAILPRDQADRETIGRLMLGILP